MVASRRRQWPGTGVYIAHGSSRSRTKASIKHAPCPYLSATCFERRKRASPGTSWHGSGGISAYSTDAALEPGDIGISRSYHISSHAHSPSSTGDQTFRSTSTSAVASFRSSHFNVTAYIHPTPKRGAGRCRRMSLRRDNSQFFTSQGAYPVLACYDISTYGSS